MKVSKVEDVVKSRWFEGRAGATVAFTLPIQPYCLLRDHRDFYKYHDRYEDMQVYINCKPLQKRKEMDMTLYKPLF